LTSKYLNRLTSDGAKIEIKKVITKKNAKKIRILGRKNNISLLFAQTIDKIINMHLISTA